MMEVNDVNLIVETEKFIKSIKISDILYFKAEICYSEINLITKEKFLIAKTLKEIQTYFQEKHFCRCHKSYLINMRYFKELKKECNGKTIVLVTGKYIPVSQRKFSFFKECFKKYMQALN